MAVTVDVLDPSGSPLAGVQITLNGVTGVSDALGRVVLQGVQQEVQGAVTDEDTETQRGVRPGHLEINSTHLWSIFFCLTRREAEMRMFCFSLCPMAGWTSLWQISPSP